VVTSLVHGQTVVRGIDVDGRPQLLENGGILQRDGVILAVDDFEKLRSRNEHEVMVGSDRHVVCPGFVNSHHHVGLTPLQLGSPDLPLELWIVRRLAGRSMPPYLDTLYSAFELLASGVTTVQHLHGRTPLPLRNIVDSASEVIRAYTDLGMRVSYSYGLRDQNRIVYEDDETFVRRLPPELAAPTRELLSEQSLDIDTSLDVFKTLIERYRGNSHVAIQLAPVNLQWCSDRAIQRTVEAARQYGVPMHMHVLETAFQREYALRRTGGSAVAHLKRLDALGPDMTIGHGVWATEGDIELLGATGTCVCHNCSSNLRLRSGIAPLNAYRKHKVVTALGIDEAGLNDDRDMLVEMRMALRVHRVPGLDDSEVPSPPEILRMATLGGAATTSFKDRIGRLEPGRAADLVLFAWDQVSSPYLSSDIGVVDALVQRARSENIAYVMVDGEIVLDHGRFLRVDRAAALAELSRTLAQPETPTEKRNRALGLGLVKYARDVYADYLSAKRGEPFYLQNARQ
jgi:5-methylthioadenosine/S-adenosylhomocysteine deaminase